MNYYKHEESDSSEFDDVSSKREYSSTSIGAGFYKTTELKEDIIVYFGARVAYVKQESNYSNSNYRFDSFSTDDLDGYSISPVFAVEYSVTKSFLFGFEGSWYYKKLKGNNSSYHDSYYDDYVGEYNRVLRTGKQDEKETGTNVMLTFRYLFK